MRLLLAEETYETGSKGLMETGMVPCESILQCEPDVTYENYPVDNADLCDPCKVKWQNLSFFPSPVYL